MQMCLSSPPISFTASDVEIKEHELRIIFRTLEIKTCGKHALERSTQ